MANEKDIVEIFTTIEKEMNGFIAASLVDIESGMTLGALSSRADFDLTDASAFNSEMVKMKMKTIKVLNLNATLEDMILTLSDQIHVIKLVSPTTFIYLAASRSGTNVAIIRTVLEKHAAELSV